MVTSNLQDKGKGEGLYFDIKPEDLSSDFKFLPPWSLDLFIRVPFQLHEEHRVSYFGALSLSYTLPTQSYQVLIFT